MAQLFQRLAPHLLLLTEVFVVITTGFLIFWSQWRSPANAHAPRPGVLERAFGRLAKQRRLAVLAVGGGVIVARIALIPILGIPEPRWHDEYSFLLAADTFAHGRLTNPTHPMWMHFETFHVLQQPTYMSMYPPGQGLVLALGQLLGHPWIGQLLITGAMASAICWMLQAWVPPSWALLGAVLAGLRIGILSYWMNSYFCGSLAAFGGALVLGALPRIMRQARLRDSALMGVGLAVLANTRPYEGVVFSLPIAAALLLWTATQCRVRAAAVWTRTVLPLTLILAVSAVATGYYFWRVSGDPFVMPYQVDRSTYAVAPYFIWQLMRPEPFYRHDVMRRFYLGFEVQDYEAGRSALGLLRRVLSKIPHSWQLYAGPMLTVPLLALPCIFRDRKMRFPLVLAGVMAIGVVIEVWTAAHYIAPATCLFFLLLVQCMRHLRWWRWNGRWLGAAWVRAVPMMCVGMILLRVFAVATGTRMEPNWPRGNLQRAAMLKVLDEAPGLHLVMVRYAADHGPNEEWVYNRADIDGAKVVWARAMGPQQDAELLRYFQGRHVWTLCPDDPNPELHSDGSH